MSKNLNFTGVLIAFSLFLALGFLFGRSRSGSLPVENNASCSASMRRVIAAAQGDVYDYAGVTEFDEPGVEYLASYSVDGDALTDPALGPVPFDLKDEQNDFQLQNEAWKVFTELIPPQDRTMVAQFNVFTDGADNTLAAVDQIGENPSAWILEVDIADLEDESEFLFTVIHEYAHLLTLNASQVTPDEDIIRDPYNLVLQTEKAALCRDYFTGLGCSHPDSYIREFHERFWREIDDEWKRVDALQYQAGSQIPYYNALHDFYRSHLDRFVDDYAVTHPTEDIAESFAYFIFSPKPVGDSIKEQKVAFFYEYPELVRLREDILTGACALDD